MKKAFWFSLKRSIPVLVSFFPVGIAYGILMQAAGYNWLWTGCCSLTVFAGALQFLMITFLNGGTPLLTAALLAALLNSRHIFYGIPLIEKWRKYGPWKLFLIYALPDEAFSLHCVNDYDDGDPEHQKMTYVFTAALVLLYWVIPSTLGALLGSVLPFGTDGIDFALTALFLVILMGQLESARSVLPAVIAFASALLCLLVLGPDGFILPALALTVVLLFVLRPSIERKEAEQ